MWPPSSSIDIAVFTWIVFVVFQTNAAYVLFYQQQDRIRKPSLPAPKTSPAPSTQLTNDITSCRDDSTELAASSSDVTMETDWRNPWGSFRFCMVVKHFGSEQTIFSSSNFSSFSNNAWTLISSSLHHSSALCFKCCHLLVKMFLCWAENTEPLAQQVSMEEGSGHIWNTISEFSVFFSQTFNCELRILPVSLQFSV